MIDFDATVLAAAAGAFAQPVTYVPAAGPAVSTAPDGTPLVGIFDAKHVEIAFKQGDEVSTQSPVLSLRQSVLPNGLPPAQGEAFIIAGIAYLVTDPQPDGMGDVKVMLRRAED